MNRKLPTHANYLIGTLLVLALAIPVGIAVVVIAGIYWTSRAIRALAEPTIPEVTT